MTPNLSGMLDGRKSKSPRLPNKPARRPPRVETRQRCGWGKRAGGAEALVKIGFKYRGEEAPAHRLPLRFLRPRMAFHSGSGFGAGPSGGSGRRGPDLPQGVLQPDRVRVTVDGEDLTVLLARHDNLRATVAELLEASLRERELYGRANHRLFAEVAILQQQVAILSSRLAERRNEDLAAEESSSKPQ